MPILTRTDHDDDGHHDDHHDDGHHDLRGGDHFLVIMMKMMITSYFWDVFCNINTSRRPRGVFSRSSEAGGEGQRSS